MANRTQINYIVAEVNGDTVPLATVRVIKRSDGSLANITINQDGTGGQLNPTIADGAGRIQGWIEEGSYTIIVSATSFATYSRAYEAIYGANVGYVGDSAVTTPKIVDNVLTTSHIADSQVITVKIGDNQVTEPKLSDDSIITRTFAAKAVGTAELATDAVTQAKLVDNAVGQRHVAALAVTSAELADNSFTTAKLVPSSIATADIASNAVDATNLDVNVITSAKIADDAVKWSAIQEEWMPPGTIVAFPKPFSNANWLPCDGAAVSRATYARLFAWVGTAFGVGDGSTTFNVPDTRGRFLYGKATHAWIANVGLNDNLTLNRRSANHYHSIFDQAMTQGGHQHTALSPSVNFDWAYPEAACSGVYYWVGDPGASGTSGNGAHSHGVSGYLGYAGNITDSPGFQVVHHYIRA